MGGQRDMSVYFASSLFRPFQEAECAVQDFWPCGKTATRSPDLPINGLRPRNPRKLHGVLLIYRPQRDGRLSWPGRLTHSGHFTHKVVTCQP